MYFPVYIVSAIKLRRYNKKLFSIHDKQQSMDHTTKIKPNQSVPTMISLEKPRMY